MEGSAKKQSEQAKYGAAAPPQHEGWGVAGFVVSLVACVLYAAPYLLGRYAILPLGIGMVLLGKKFLLAAAVVGVMTSALGVKRSCSRARSVLAWCGLALGAAAGLYALVSLGLAV